MKSKKIFLLILIFILWGFVYHFGYADYSKVDPQKFILEKREIAWNNLEKNLLNDIKQFKGDVGVVIKDLETGWEIPFGDDKLFPSASLAKIPLMAVCLLAVEEGKIRLKRNAALKSSDKLTGSGVLKNMTPGIFFNIEELIGLMISDSDNTATNILTNIVGINYVRDSLKNFGLKHTNFSRKIADYKLRDSGIENYTSASDIASLLEKMYKRNLVSKSASEHCLRFMKLSRSSDRIPKYLPVDLTIAHKTGLERGVCHDAGIVFTPKGSFIVAVLTKHKNPSSIPSKQFIANTALRVYNYFEQF